MKVSMRGQCPHCSGELRITFEAAELKPTEVRLPRGRKNGSTNKNGVPCPDCGKPNGGVWSEQRFSGYWRRHKCRGCGRKYASVRRDDGTVDVYDVVAPPSLWVPFSPLLNSYPPKLQEGDNEGTNTVEW